LESVAVFIGIRSQGHSVLKDLTSEEWSELNLWSKEQQAEITPERTVDLMNWPGWSSVMTRRIEAIGKLVKTTQPIVTDEFWKLAKA
jgi:hypothetical protein